MEVIYNLCPPAESLSLFWEVPKGAAHSITHAENCLGNNITGLADVAFLFLYLISFPASKTSYKYKLAMIG